MAPDLEHLLTHRRARIPLAERFAEAQIRRETAWVTMRDGVRLATDLYLPPILSAAAVAIRSPYGRARDLTVPALLAFARHGYVVISQDCRGTGESEPAVWDYGLYEGEDGFDFVEWVRRQSWFNGSLFSFGGSYVGATQWALATHPAMSAIAPEMQGLRVTRSTVRRYMFVNVYPRVVGKGANRLKVPVNEIERLLEQETMAGGYFNAPLRTPLPEAVFDHHPHLRTVPLPERKLALWKHYCSLPAVERARLVKVILGVGEFSYEADRQLPYVFDGLTPYGLNSMPAVDAASICERFVAPALVISGWYDWNLQDTLQSWIALRRHARQEVTERSRLIITPAAHHVPGYREEQSEHPELQHSHRLNVELLLHWYEAVQKGTLDTWSRVVYYLLGANEWRVASDWPVPEAKPMAFYLDSGGTLTTRAPQQTQTPDRYTYDPDDPTPTVGGSILSFLYPAGSVDVAEVQKRQDVLTYTTAPLERDLDVVGPIRLILYASSTAVDTDFVGRLSDVFPDGRAIQLQNGILRTRYRHFEGEPELMEPGKIYRLEIDLWATANRFKAGHRLRLDISSADFPRFDRNANRGGEPGEPIAARQSIYHDSAYPSHLLLAVMVE